MKKLLFALCAVALMGLMTGCVDPMNNQIPNPNYDPIKDKVTTQFYLNIAPASDNTRTKQSDTAVQANYNISNPFRGLGNATLFTIIAPSEAGDIYPYGDGKKIKRVYKGGNNPQAGDTLFANSYISLSDALKPGVIGPGSTEASRRVIEISIPRETNTLLFYGEAITGESDDMLNSYGGLEYTMDGNNLLSIGCNARRRLHPDSTATQDFFKIENVILSVLNHLFRVGLNFESQTPYGWENLYTKTPSTIGQYNLSGRQIHWSDFQNCLTSTDLSPIPALFGITGSTKLVSPLEQALGTVYKAFTTLNEIEVTTATQTKKIKELRAGSGMSIVRQARDIHAVVSSALESLPMSDEEEIAELILREIDAYLHKFFEVDNESNLTGWKHLYTDQSTGQYGVVDLLKVNKIDTLPVPVGTIYTLNAFPFHFNMPVGSVTLVADTLSTTNIFKFQTDDIDLSDMGGEYMSITDYTYPPSLVYFGNSPIRTSNHADASRTTFPDGWDNWENDAKWKQWDPSTQDTLWRYPWHVEADTRAVAMIYNIHYGCALLATTVKYSDAVYTGGGVLKDNNFLLNGDPDKQIPIGETIDPVTGAKSTITLTGILVGGQPNHVGWDYTPRAPMGGTLSFNRMVYDKMMNGAQVEHNDTTDVFSYPVPVPTTQGSTTLTNYTTLFDNYNSKSGFNQDPVYVALEFRNDLGQDFWGNTNMVRSGGTFYLMGCLRISDDQKNNFDWSKASPIMPPYYEVNTTDAKGEHKAGDRIDAVRVFMQNFITSASFVIGPDALKGAYVTVPDLRSATMSFGLSVDLRWQPGLQFTDIPIGY